MNDITYPGLMNWRLYGEHGVSSEAIADRLQYGRTSPRFRGGNYPCDPGDFRRCELLLDAAPLMRLDLHLMAEESPAWAALVSRWDEIAALAEEECPSYKASRRGSAPMTYELMRSIIDRSAREDLPDREGCEGAA